MTQETALLSTLSFDDLACLSAGDAGLSQDQARSVLTGVLGLLERHASRDALVALFDAVPGAEAAARSQAAVRPRSGLFGGILAGAGGLSGRAMADAMGLAEQLKDEGVERPELKRLLPAARERVREVTGRDVLGEAVRSVPGVGGLLGDT